MGGLVGLLVIEAIALLSLSLWRFGVIRRLSLWCFTILKSELVLIGDIGFGVGISALAGVFNDAIKATARTTELGIMILLSMFLIVAGAIMRRKGRKWLL
ncbi:MAG: hypothetical protein LBI57_02550 [Helicobacteraceae bacterium]|jgi:predicted transporter|nr:hypothetical protein [Helicobacteraceae bacterium]